VGAPLDKSHPDIVKEIQRLANKGKKQSEIKIAIKEKFNYTTSLKAIKNWAGVAGIYFDTRSGTQLTPAKIEEIRVLMSGDSPPTNREAVKILDVSEHSIIKHKGTVAKYLTVEEWAEKYPDMRDNLLSNDKETVRKARDAAHARRQREVLAAIKKAAANVSFDPLTDKQMRQLAEDKAASVLKNQKIRALKYRVGPIGGGPSSYISYADYRKLEKKPEILGRHYQGNFSTDSVREMKKTYADKVYSFLKAGGNPNLIPFHFGHILPMKGVGMSGLTNIHNVQIQDIDFNRQQSNKVTNELLKKYGYHTGFFNPRAAGALAIGSAATLGFMSLLSPEGRKAAEVGVEKVKTVGESVLRNNPKIMETLALLGVPQEKMFETIYNLQGQGEWEGDRRIDAGDIVQNAMGQDWMARNPRLYAGISTLADFGIDPLVGLGKVGGLLKSGVSGLRKLRNIWD